MTETMLGGMPTKIFTPEYSNEQELAVVPIHVLKHLLRGAESVPIHVVRQRLINRLIDSADTQEQYLRILKEEYDFHATIEALTLYFHEQKREEAFPDGKLMDMMG